MQQLEQQRRAHDLRLAEMDQRSQEDSRKVAEALLTVTREAHRNDTRYTVAFLILAFVSCLQVLSLAWPDGLPWARQLVGNGPVAATALPTSAQPPSTVTPTPLPSTPSIGVPQPTVGP